MTRSPARTCTAAATLALALAGSLGVLSEAAWAIDLPTPSPAPAPVLPQLVPVAPVAVPTALPAPVQSLLPAPVATAADGLLPNQPSAAPKPTAQPSAAPTAAPAPAKPAGQRQQARSRTGIEALPATQPLSATVNAPALRALRGVVAPVAVAPEAVRPRLAPVPAYGAPGSIPTTRTATAATEGLPAIVVALAIGTVTAAAAGQVAEMAARRRSAKA